MNGTVLLKPLMEIVIGWRGLMLLNDATRKQLKAVILIDCIEKCNAMKVTSEEYDRNLRAMLKERWGETGQTELPV